jgi:hypothetical protein
MAIDDKTGEYIEIISNHFNRLYMQLVELLDDYKRKNPDLVSNLKVLGGSRNSELIKLLMDRTQDISRFISIMKNFTIIQSVPIGQQPQSE